MTVVPPARRSDTQSAPGAPLRISCQRPRAALRVRLRRSNLAPLDSAFLLGAVNFFGKVEAKVAGGATVETGNVWQNEVRGAARRHAVVLLNGLAELPVGATRQAASRTWQTASRMRQAASRMRQTASRTRQTASRMWQPASRKPAINGILPTKTALSAETQTQTHQTPWPSC